MSNRNDDFDFGDDLFGDEDDLFGRRSEREDDSSMKFDDFADDADFENGIELPDDDVDFDNDEERERRGPNRAFIFIAVLFLIILLGGFALLAFVILGGRGPSDIDITRTAIAQINSTTEALALATQAAATVQAELTQTALAFSPTPSITPSPTATSTPTIDAEATNQFIAGMTATAEENARSTAVAARNATATQIAINAAEAQQTPGENGQGGGDDATPTPESGIPSLNAVQQTATALAELFSQQPTQVVVTPGPGIVPTQPGALPDSGLFDDLAGGNPSLLFLAAFGLLGVIFVTRRLRSGNRK